jgi:hypothetical protein
MPACTLHAKKELKKAPFGALFLFAEHYCQFRQTLPERFPKIPGDPCMEWDVDC